MAFSNRMRGTEMFSKYVWSLYIWKHSTSKVSPRKYSFLNEMSCVHTLTRFVWGLYIWKYSRRKRNKALQTNGRVKNRWSRRTGSEVYADPPTWNFRVQACDSNYITLKQIQIIDTLVAKFRKAHNATPRHDTFKTPGHILWKHLCAPHSIGESHAMTTPSICCFFICTNPNQTSILGSGGNLQLPRAKKKLIELSFKSCRAWWHGPAP